MSSHPLDPDTRLGIALSALMSRNRFTADPGAVIAQLHELAGDRTDILAAEVGGWVGFYEDEHTRVLAAALRGLPLDLDEHIRLGAQRRRTPRHTTP